MSTIMVLNALYYYSHVRTNKRYSLGQDVFSLNIQLCLESFLLIVALKLKIDNCELQIRIRLIQTSQSSRTFSEIPTSVPICLDLSS